MIDVAHRRALLSPQDATTEGARLLRAALRKQSFAGIARRLHCDAGSVRLWAREETRPGLVLRARASEVLDIQEASWDEPRSVDLYTDGEPETTKR